MKAFQPREAQKMKMNILQKTREQLKEMIDFVHKLYEQNKLLTAVI